MSNKPIAVTDVDTFETWRLAFNTLLSIAPEVVESTSSPVLADDDYELGTIWVKTDTDEAWILVHSTLGEGGAELNDAVWLALGSTPGALLNDGTVPLISNWDVGSYQIRAETFHADVTTGTAPFVIDSTTMVTNLNADMVDGIQGAEILQRDGSTALTSNWAVGGLDITGVGGFSSEMITATAVGSTRLVLGDIIAQLGSSVSGTVYSAGRSINNGSFVLSGGATQTNGFNIKLYGNSHSTQANDVEFKAQGAIKLQWDHSQTRWDFKTQDIWNPGLVDGRDVAADGTKLDGIATSANNYTHPNHTGDVTSTGDGATVIANEAVTNAKLAHVTGPKIKGRVTSGVGDVEDFDILGLTEETAPATGDFLLGQEAGGAFRKFPAGSWNPDEPVFIRNPYKNHYTHGAAASTTVPVDCEQYPSFYIRATGGTVVIDLQFPAFSSPPERGLTDMAMSGKVFVKNEGATSITVTSNALISPFGSGGDGAKGIEPLSNGDYGILVWEFFDDGFTRFVWSEWVSE